MNPHKWLAVERNRKTFYPTTFEKKKSKKVAKLFGRFKKISYLCIVNKVNNKLKTTT